MIDFGGYLIAAIILAVVIVLLFGDTIINDLFDDPNKEDDPNYR